jgi:hypothetical protein
MTTKDTKHNLMLVKKNILERYIKRILSRSEVASMLSMHPNAVSRLKVNYQKYGDVALVGRKTGPKSNFRPCNRTPEEIEDIIAAEGSKHPELGPKPLADHLLEIHQIITDPTTIWRILKRTLHYSVQAL